VDFSGEARFDNPRAVQVRLPAFELALLEQVGRRVRDLYASGTPSEETIRRKVDDACVRHLANTVTGQLGGKVGVAPRIFLKKLVEKVLDPAELYPDFDPVVHAKLELSDGELTVTERAARGATNPDDIQL
jgi:hypothetical protein